MSSHSAAIRSPKAGDSSNRSTTLSKALSDLSARKASICSSVGGNPVRSNVTRRINRSRAASRVGTTPPASSRDNTNRSIGLRHQPPFLTAGTWTAATGWKDQCAL